VEEGEVVFLIGYSSQAAPRRRVVPTVKLDLPLSRDAAETLEDCFLCWTAEGDYFPRMSGSPGVVVREGKPIVIGLYSGFTQLSSFYRKEGSQIWLQRLVRPKVSQGVIGDSVRRAAR
jgi:hypothetical protein